MATRTISAAGGNFNATSTWDEGIVPGAGDAVVARSDGTSGNLTINVASGGTGLASFIMTNYTGTLTFNNNLTVGDGTTGTVTFVPEMTIAGTGDLIVDTAATLTSGGKTLTGGLQLKGGQTYTLADNWTVEGLVTLFGTNPATVNGQTIKARGGLSVTTDTSGTTVFSLESTGTWSGTSTLQNNLTFNAGAATITLSGTLNYNTGTLTYTSGTISAGTSTLTCSAATTFNTSGMNWANITLSGSSTYTLSSQLNLTGTLTISANAIFSGAFNIATGALTTSGATQGITLSGNITASGLWTSTSSTSFTWSGAFDITADSFLKTGAGSITLPRSVVITNTSTFQTNSSSMFSSGGVTWRTGGLTTTTTLNGSTKIILTGGTWSAGAGTLNNNCDLAGNVTISGTVNYGTNTLTYVSGTITTTGSTLNLTANCTLNTPSANMTWNNITVGAGVTVTITNAFTAGTLTLPNGAATFAGSGFTVGTLTNTALGITRTHTFASSQTYNITGRFENVGATSTIRQLIKASTPGTKAIITLKLGATQDLGYADPTDIDSSLGQQIFTFRGTVTTSNNWTTTIPLSAVVVNRPRRYV
jgi:hypothetical protein